MESLTTMERMAFEGLQARDRLIFIEHIEPLQAAMQATVEEVERRLGLAAGAIGTTHELRFDDWTVVALNNSAGNGLPVPCPAPSEQP